MVFPCHLCGSEAELKFVGHVGYQRNKNYDICHCLNCNTAFASPLKIDSSIYDHIYGQADQISGYSRYLTYAKQVLKVEKPLEYLAKSEDVYWSIQEYFKRHKNKKVKVLEIGCGFGYLTYALSKAGIDVQGIDISQLAIDQAVDRYGNYFICADVLEYAPKNKHQYDVILLLELIEHIPDIKKFLKATAELLRPGGDLVMTTPNKTAYPTDILWETEPPPVHLWWLSEKSISILAKQMECQVTFIDFLPFDLYEIEQHGNHSKPFTHFQSWQPSRTPRLDENGLPLNIGDFISLPPTPVPPTPCTFKGKEMVKTIANQFGLLELFKKLKKMKHDYQYKRHLKKLLKLRKANPTPRSTLCAILSKPKLRVF